MSPKKDDQSRSKIEESPDDADRTFANRHRPNIIGGLNRKNNSGHWSAPIDIYLSTLWNFISKRWPIIFFTV